jgi:hypothetical protein
MKENLDPRIDKMMAFLYGELAPSEDKAFRRLLESDAALRAEMEELGEVRGALAAWSVEEHVPSFVLVDQGASDKARRRPAGESVWSRFLDSLRSLGATPAWGLAAAALLLFALAGSGFRVERVPGGLAFRLGADRAPTQTQVPETASPSAEDPLRGLGAGQPLELASPRTGGDVGSTVVPVSGSYMTRDEFESYNAQLLSTLAQLLNNYDERRDHETADLMQGLYQRINEQQVFDYERVSRRIDALGMQVAVDKGRSLDEPQGAARPSNESVPGRTEGEE